MNASNDRIASAAIAWNDARVEAKRLRQDRVLAGCQPKFPAEPCWKVVSEEYSRQPDDAPAKAPVAEWCPLCQEREAIHLDYKAATKKRGIALRRLQLLCRRLPPSGQEARDADPLAHIVQFSGGKDSTALVLWAKEHLPAFTAVFCDTHWEHPLTYAYVQHINETQLDGRLVTVKSEKYHGLADLSRQRKIVPSVRMRFCTEELKIKPFVAWMREHAGEGATVYQGIRAEESHARSTMPRRVWEPLYEAWIERPLFDWTSGQVFDLHRRYGVEPNPLYKMGARRVGCFPCVMISKGELRRLSGTLPEVWDRAQEVENAVAEGRAFFRHDYIPERFHTGNYAKVTAEGAPVEGTFPTVQDVKFYVTRPDQLDLWDDEPTRCLSVYNLCE